MFLRTIDPLTYKSLISMIPGLEIITLGKIVSFLNLETWNEGWAPFHGTLNEEHMLGLAYVQGNFKNHVMDMSGLKAFQENIDYLERSGHSEMASAFKTKKRLSQNHKKDLFILGEDVIDRKDELADLPIVRDPNYNKILCFPKGQPITLGGSFQKLCLESSIKALGLKDLCVQSAIKYIGKSSKMPMLLHGAVLSDQSIYSGQLSDERNMPKEILVFCKYAGEKPAEVEPFPSFKTLLKNYAHRDSFQNKSKTELREISIRRFTHLRTVHSHISTISLEEGADDGED